VQLEGSPVLSVKPRDTEFAQFGFIAVLGMFDSQT
jgi:hypothetical protein